DTTRRRATKMPLHIAVFEDDVELADLIQEILEHYRFKVTCHYSLQQGDTWSHADVILADFRNYMVAFEQIEKQSSTRGIPVIAISGSETGFSPQVLKPFRIEVLQKAIYQSLVEAGRLPEARLEPLKRALAG